MFPLYSSNPTIADLGYFKLVNYQGKKKDTENQHETIQKNTENNQTHWIKKNKTKKKKEKTKTKKTPKVDLHK